MQFYAFIISFFLISQTLFGNNTASDLPKNCEHNKECLQELEGSVCGDGTPSFYTLTVKPEAKNLLIYLQGGGACWDFKSCTMGLAKTLTRVLPSNDWIGGKGISNSKSDLNPFREDTVVTVPYCTGDVFAGTRNAEYVSGESKKKVKHQGYQNMLLTLEALRKQYPNPERVTMVGESAGGMGVIFHLRNVVKAFPNSKIYVISDGGVPFKPPYLNKDSYDTIMKNWGANTNNTISNFSELIAENIRLYPDVHFGIVASYFDYVMTFFAKSVGSPDSLKAVKNTLIDVSNNYIGVDRPNQKVFYLDDVKHVYLDKDLNKQSMGISLSHWLKSMLSMEETSWKNVRPDMHYKLIEKYQSCGLECQFH